MVAKKGYFPCEPAFPLDVGYSQVYEKTVHWQLHVQNRILRRTNNLAILK